MTNMDDKFPELEKRLSLIEQRNQRVELDKAWEQSLARRTAIVLLTYLGTLLVFYLIEAPNYWLNALIPTLGYYLSTLSVSQLKKLWMQRGTRDSSCSPQA